MKKLFALLCIGASLFVGCSDGDDNGGSLTIGGVNLVGTWAITEDWYGKNERIEEVVIIKNSSIHWYEPNESWYDKWYEDYSTPLGFIFSNGYLQGCSMSDFEETGEAKCYISDGRLYIASIYNPVTIVNEDKFFFWDEDNGAYGVYERIKGFK